MEEVKHDDLKRPQETDAQWFWQSDPDPFKQKDPTKWNWNPYPEDSCSIIEEAFSLNKPTVDIGNYEIDLKKMIQVSKNDAYKIRRVKRKVVENRMSMELPLPSFIDNEQKTFSEAFGNVHHFLDYIMKRTAEAYNIYKKLKGLTLDSKMNEFDDIIQEVINSIQQAAGMRVKMTNARVLSKRNPLTEAKEAIEKIKAESQDLRGFLQTILRIYTMESFICYLMNELLRNENWRDLNILTPYLVCLTYTFQLQDYIIKQERNKGVKESLLSLFNMKTLMVYRGAALTEEHLARYDPQKNKYFSWNSVTSTSRDKGVALGFLLNSMKNVQGEKRGVLFHIETDFSLLEDCEGMIDVSMNSRYPNEKEVILVPGTVFKIKSKKLNNENIYEIRLVIKKKFKDNQKGLSLLGSLVKKVTSKDRAILDGLTQDEIIRSVQLLAGNKLIKKLEVKNCNLDLHLTELIRNMIMSTNLKPENVKIFHNNVSVDSLSSLFFFFSSDNLNNILFLNDVVFVENIKKREFMEGNWRLKKLSLEEKTLKKLLKDKQIRALLDIIMTEEELGEINLFIGNIFSEDELSDIAKYITKNQCSLKGLSLDLNETTEEHRLQLEKVLRSTKDLQSLSLNFTRSELSEQELNEFIDMIMDLALIQHLSLDFTYCRMNNGLIKMSESLAKLTTLTSLSLIHSCYDITENGLTRVSESLVQLTTLTNLSLDFGGCKQITDDEFSILSDSLAKLATLTNLSLNFKDDNIFDQGITRLSDSLAKLTALTNLSLNFGWCSQITDKGLTHLSESLVKLTSLTNLSLDLGERWIADNGLARLSDSLVKLTTLTDLSLSFHSAFYITDNGLTRLSESLAKLITLTNLSLNFYHCDKITDNGLTRLSDSLVKLTALTNLSLNLYGWRLIADSGLTRLSESLAKLTTLTNLVLNFSQCVTITDDGLTRLSESLAKLTTLTNLSLDFPSCENVMDKGLIKMSESLAKLTALTNLLLNFSHDMITDKGLTRLSDSLAKLTTLTNLSLNFYDCDAITDKGLTRLSQSLAKLTILTNLSFNFYNDKIRDNGLARLSDGLAKNCQLDVLYGI